MAEAVCVELATDIAITVGEIDGFDGTAAATPKEVESEAATVALVSVVPVMVDVNVCGALIPLQQTVPCKRTERRQSCGTEDLLDLIADIFRAKRVNLVS